MESMAVILPIIAAGSVVFITGLSLYFKIRHKFPIRVNCWFCNNNTDVPYGNRNCWDCPNCEQYNGFLPDGSYNKVIPAQHDELLNHPVHATFVRKKPMPSDAIGNGLCRKCNINQKLKVEQLAVFTPVNPARYDEEVDEFRHHLERSYRLCSPCEEVLKQTLYKQKSMLLGFRLKQLCNSSLHTKGLISLLKTRFFQFLSWGHITHYFTAILAAWIVLATSFNLNKGQLPFPPAMLNSTVWSAVDISPHIISLLPGTLTYDIPLTVLGIVAQFAATIPKKRNKIDIICLCFWILLHIQSWLRRWKKLEMYISLLDFNIVHVIVAFVTLCVCTYNALVPQRRYATVKCHKIARKVRTLNSSSESSRDIFNISDDSSTPALQNCQQKYVDSDTSPHEDDSKLHKVCDYLTGTSSPLSAPISHHIKKSPLSVTSTYEDDNSEDLGRGFGNLTLGSSSHEKWANRKNSDFSSFETKVYGQNSCSDLFDGGQYCNLRNREKPVIRPSQLNLRKNVTQSSWVAGGYWQSPIHSKALPVPGKGCQDLLSAATGFAPLSRSSSQSSGFVSQSSQPGIYDSATSLPNSRTGSICGADFDRFSALSEPIYPYATAPVYYAGARPGTFIGAPYYGGPPVFMHQSYSMVPQSPGFLPNYGSPLPPQPQPAQCYYTPRSPRPLGPIWNQSAFSPIPIKQAQTPAVDVLSRSSSQNSDESQGSLSKSSAQTIKKRECVPGRRTFLSAVQENIFLAILFFGSLLFNALILGCVMLGNSNMLLPGIL